MTIISVKPEKGKVYATIPKWDPAYRVSFQIMIMSVDPDITEKSVFRIGKDHLDGYMLPSVYLNQNSRLKFHAHIGETYNQYIDQFLIRSRHKWYNFTIKQSFNEYDNQVGTQRYTLRSNYLY